MVAFPPKDPDDVLDYRFDWSGRIAGDPISGAEFIVSPGLSVLDVSFDASSASVWIEGGAAGETETIMSRVRTATGRQYDFTATIPVQNA